MDSSGQVHDGHSERRAVKIPVRGTTNPGTVDPGLVALAHRSDPAPVQDADGPQPVPVQVLWSRLPGGTGELARSRCLLQHTVEETPTRSLLLVYGRWYCREMYGGGRSSRPFVCPLPRISPANGGRVGVCSSSGYAYGPVHREDDDQGQAQRPRVGPNCLVRRQ